MCPEAHAPNRNGIQRGHASIVGAGSSDYHPLRLEFGSIVVPHRPPPVSNMAPLAYWRRIHRWPRRLRWPLKAVVFAATVLLVLYPKVWLLPAWLGRLRDLNAVLDPDHPGLAELEARVTAEVGEGGEPAEVLAAVERTVYARIPYAWDWETWGVMDYLPTVAEVFAKGREDCDGRAVVAASLLQRLGYEAWLVGDLKHIWVATPQAEIMSPGEGTKTLVGGETGTRTTLTLGTLANLARGLSYGIVVFPLAREALLLTVLCLLTLHPRSSLRRQAAGCLLLAGGLALIRMSGASAAGLADRPVLVWAGLAAALIGWVLLAVKADAGHSLPAPPE